MQSSILTTKLYLPQARTGWVLRPRLLSKLDAGLAEGCKLALVSAPAGFGKTTLVTEWIAALKTNNPSARVAWLSLDSGDNDLVIFFNYLVAALRTCQPGVGEVTSQLLEHSPLPPVETLLLPLVNDLTGASGPLVLVLDDYHAIQQPSVHEALALLIERQPPGMQVILTTRQDPFLPLARWRARNMLREIRLKDLRFTEEEAAVFLNRALGFNLQAVDIAALESRTEGWIAGLQLAAVSLLQSNDSTGSESASGFVQSFTGNDRFVMDYLVDEVLSRQPEAVQRFLLRSAVLERFNAGLCEILLDDAGLAPEHASPEAVGSSEAIRSPEAILDYLDRANLFLIPLDNRREWYRYHHLFTELLRYRLKITAGKTFITALKRRASQWFDENGYPEEAIYYAQSAADWDLYARLLIKNAPVLFQQAEMARLSRWFSGLPEQVLRASPELCRYYGYLLSITGRLDLGYIYLELARQGLPNDAYHQGSTLAFASHNTCFRGDFEGQIEQARRALELLPHSQPWMRGIAAVSLGLGLCHVGDPAGSEKAMQEALAAGQQAQSVRTCVHALTYLGRVSVLRLDFAHAEIFFLQATQYRVGSLQFPGSDMAHFDLAQLKYEQNDLEQAMAYVQAGIEVNQRSGGIEMRAYAYRQMARLRQLEGKTEEAHAYLQKALQLAVEYNLSPLTLSLNAACQVEMALAEGGLAEAGQAAPLIGNPTGVYTFNFYPDMARAHLLIAQGRREEALSFLAPVLPRAEQPGWEYPLLQVRVLQALAEGDAEKVSAHLEEALGLAARSGAIRCFLDLGAPMLALLHKIRPQVKQPLKSFLESLLSAFEREVITSHTGEEDLPAASQRANSTLIEPLSDRELEVLRLLADGLTNVEIAQRLYLSPNTLKAHTQNIYAKMDVHSRVQVVNKARELGLID